VASRIRDRVHLVTEHFDHHQTKYIIGQLDFFIGARMHACIAALSQAVPAVGLAYSRKFAGVFESLGVGNLVVDLRSGDDSSISERVNKLFERRHEFAAELGVRVPGIRAKVLNLLKNEPSEKIAPVIPSCR
jgi:polysaccharide pyruvyl transferase WcaK-like protein